MTDEEDAPIDNPSRKASWAAFAIAGSALGADLFSAIAGFFGNLLTIFSFHLNYTYDRADADKADAPHIRTE